MVWDNLAIQNKDIRTSVFSNRIEPFLAFDIPLVVNAGGG
jgi:hypothetical protein